MVKVKIPEKFCRFTFFIPYVPSFARRLSLFFLCLYLSLSLSVFPSLFFVAYRQSLFHSLRVFEKRPLVTLFENVAQNGIRVVSIWYYIIELLSPLSISSLFRSSFFLLFVYHQLLVPSDSMSRRCCLRHLDDYSSISPPIFTYLISFSLSFTFITLDEELEAIRAYTTHFTSLIRNNS